MSLIFQPCSPALPGIEAAKIPWDSEALGLDCYELRVPPDLISHSHVLSEWLAGLQSPAGSLIYTRIEPGQIELGAALTNQGFYLVEATLELRLRLRQLRLDGANYSNPVRLRPPQKGDWPELRRLAANAFLADRLHLDPHVPAGGADRRMVRWLEAALVEEKPLLVFSPEESDEVWGFFFYEPVGPEIMQIQLVAVDAQLKRRGLGQAMTGAGLALCRDRGFELSTTRVSLNNYSSTQGCLDLGFRLHRTHYTFHCFRPPA